MTYPEHVPQYLIIHEPNYTQVPNELLDRVCELEPAESIIALIICRQTFGWHKDRDVISLTQMEKKTGFSRKTIVRAVEGLVKKGVIERLHTKKGCAYRLLVEKVHSSGEIPPDASGESTHTKETITKETKILTKDQAAPVSAHMEFIDKWSKSFEAEFGHPYQFESGRDGKAVKLLVANLPVDDLIARAQRAWSISKSDKDAWNCRQAATIHGFRERLNNIIMEIAARKKVKTLEEKSLEEIARRAANL